MSERLCSCKNQTQTNITISGQSQQVQITQSANAKSIQNNATRAKRGKMLVTEDTFGFAFSWLKKRKLLNNGFVVNFQPCESDTDMTCLKVPCYLGRMRRGDQVKIQMMSRLWQNTLIKVLAVGQRNCAFRSCSCYTYLFLTDFKPLCFQAKAGSVNLTTTAKVAPPSSVSEPNEKDNVVKVCVSFSGEGQS